MEAHDPNAPVEPTPDEPAEDAPVDPDAAPDGEEKGTDVDEADKPADLAEPDGEPNPAE